MLDETGDLQRLVREVVASVTLFKDDDKRMFAKVTTWLDNFTVDGSNPVGAAKVVAEEGLEPPTRGL